MLVPSREKHIHFALLDYVWLFQFKKETQSSVSLFECAPFVDLRARVCVSVYFCGWYFFHSYIYSSQLFYTKLLCTSRTAAQPAWMFNSQTNGTFSHLFPIKIPSSHWLIRQYKYCFMFEFMNVANNIQYSHARK